MKSLGMLVFHEWGDEVIDRPDNSEELMTASIMDWWNNHGGIVHYFDERFDGEYREFNIDPGFFYPEVRKYVYIEEVMYPEHGFPDLDYLLVRWRWDNGREDDSYIMRRQREVVEYYERHSTKIVIWDEDYKFSADSTPEWLQDLHCDNVTVHRVRVTDTEKFFTGLPCTSTLHCPIADAFLRSLPPADVKLPYTGFGDCKDPSAVMVYVGNNYDRAGALDNWINGFSANYPNRIHVYGNWLKYQPIDLKNVVQHSKASKAEIEQIHRRAFFVPMIAKDIYFEEGHITPRLYEVLAGGAIPVGLICFTGASFYYAGSVYGSPGLFTREWGLMHFHRMDDDQKRMWKKSWDDAYDRIIKAVLANNVFSVERFLADGGIHE